MKLNAEELLQIQTGSDYTSKLHKTPSTFCKGGGRRVKMTRLIRSMAPNKLGRAVRKVSENTIHTHIKKINLQQILETIRKIWNLAVI